MQSVVNWYMSTIGNHISPQMAVFLISMFPVMELRAGMLVGVLLKVPLWESILLSITGNIIPIAGFLFIVQKIARIREEHGHRNRLAEWAERITRKHSSNIGRTQFWGLTAFVAIPLPGTGAWSGALIASALRMETRRAALAIFCGMCIALFIMCIVSYGVLGHIVH